MFKNKNEEDEEDTDSQMIGDNIKYDEEYYNNYIKQFTKHVSDLSDSTTSGYEGNLNQRRYINKGEQGYQDQQQFNEDEEYIENIQLNKNMRGCSTIRFLGCPILNFFQY